MFPNSSDSMGFPSDFGTSWTENRPSGSLRASAGDTDADGSLLSYSLPTGCGEMLEPLRISSLLHFAGATREKCCPALCSDCAKVRKNLLGRQSE